MDQPLNFEAYEALDGAALRTEPRDSILVMASIGRPGEAPVVAKVRDVSNGGMMADCAASFSKGETLEVQLRGVGAVCGTVAWVDAGGRIGLAFDRRIDATLVRKPVQAPAAAQPMLVKAVTSSRRPGLTQRLGAPAPPRRFR